MRKYQILSIMIMVVGSFLSGCTLFNVNLAPTMAPLKEKVVSGDGKHKVLLVDIQGVISNEKKTSALGVQTQVGMVEQIREILNKAEKEEGLEALILRINSPGGTVTSSDIICHDIIKFKEKTGIKVYAIMMDIATSGGYYIAQAADKIIAHPTTITGSIGVIAVKMNLNGLMGKIGVDMEVVKSGDKKDFLSPFRALSSQERALFQETINSLHTRFVQTITENRPKLDKDDVEELADGRIYTAQQALNEGLVDQVAYMDEASDYIAKELGVGQIKIVTYYRAGEYKSNVYSSLPSNPTINLFNVDLNFLPQSSKPVFLYMWVP